MYNFSLSHLLADHQLADHVWCQHTLPWLWLSRTKGEEGQPAEDKGTKTKALQIGNLPESPFTFPSFTDKVGRRDASSLGTIVLRWLAPSNWTLDVAQIRNGLPTSNCMQPEIRNWLPSSARTRRSYLPPTSFRLFTF